MFKIQFLPSLLFAFLLIFISCKQEKDADAPKWKHNDNTVRVRQPVSIKTLNPLLYRTVYDRTAFELVFQYLKGFEPVALDLVPMLITADPMVEDILEGENLGGQIFNYEILEEAAWDDGKPVTGHDFDFSLKVLFNPKMSTQRFQAYLDYIKKIEVDAENPKKFRVHTSRKYLIAEECISNLPVFPAHIYDPENLLGEFQLADFTDKKTADKIAGDERLQQSADDFNSPKYNRELISGSGPYKLLEWVDDQRLVFVKKENWWGNKIADKYPMLAAKPDTIIFIPIPDHSATTVAIKNEDLDVSLEMDTKQFSELRDNELIQDVFDFYTPAKFTYYYTAMNNRNPKLNDKRVRRALAHTIDIDLIIKELYDGFGERVVGPISPQKKYFNTDLKPIPMDLDKARALLKEAGWEDSNGDGVVDKNIDGEQTELSIKFMYVPSSKFQENFTQLMLESAKKIGVEITKETVEQNVLGQKLRNGDYEMGGIGASGHPLPDDPKQYWHTDSAIPGGSNYSRFGNEDSDALIDAIRNEEDKDKRAGLYQEFQQMVYDEQPVIFQFAPVERMVVHKRFEVETNAMSPCLSLQHLELKKK